MKKFLRFLLILVLIIAVVILIAGLLAPKESTVTSSIEINAPKEQVWEQMVIVKNNKNWSSFTEKDPTIKLTYSGVDGQVGSAYHWTGEKMGIGSMTVTSISGNTLTYELNFKEPFEGKGDGTMQAEDAGEGRTKATWTVHFVNNNFFMGAMGYLSDMVGMGMQKDFDKGVANLKAYVESHKGETPAAAPALTVQDVQFAGNTYSGYRAKVAWQDFDKAFGEAMGKLGSRIVGAPVSIVYNWDTVKMEGDVFMGAPISAGDAIKGASVVKVPASRAYMIAYVGNPSGTETAHKAIGAHMAGKSEKETLILEEFVKTEPEEKDINKWVTNVYYLVK